MELNATNLVRILKKDRVEKMPDLRPISLCNDLYKILVKVLANRLKNFRPMLILENQSAFIPGTSISGSIQGHLFHENEEYGK